MVLGSSAGETGWHHTCTVCRRCHPIPLSAGAQNHREDTKRHPTPIPPRGEHQCVVFTNARTYGLHTSHRKTSLHCASSGEEQRRCNSYYYCRKHSSIQLSFRKNKDYRCSWRLTIASRSRAHVIQVVALGLAWRRRGSIVSPQSHSNVVG